MGDEQEEAEAARRTILEQQFRALPPPGSAGYWQCIEPEDAGQALPLEVLVRCLRERQLAGAGVDAYRIFAVIWGRVQARTQAWARAIVRTSPAARAQGFASDLEQECMFDLWRELTDEDPGIWLENFRAALNSLQHHTAHAKMQEQGFWKRRGVTTPRRIPATMTDSLDAVPPNADVHPLADRLPDTSSSDAFESVEFRELVADLSEDDRLILYGHVYGYTQQELAETLHVTDRTIRHRLTRITAQLRRQLQGTEEDDHD
jgi:RNA polymerase sigma factor (sigma-70 family)